MSRPFPKTETFLGFAKLPAKYESLVMPLLLSVLMTFIVSMVSTLRAIGPAPNFLYVWLSSWVLSWAVAFPTLLLVLPVVKRATLAIVRSASYLPDASSTMSKNASADQAGRDDTGGA